MVTASDTACWGVLIPCQTDRRCSEALNSFFLFLPQPPVFASFQDYVTGLQTVISNAVDHVKGLEAHLIALKLEELTLEDTSISPVRDDAQTACLCTG